MPENKGGGLFMRTQKSLLFITVTILLSFLCTFAFAGHGAKKVHEMEIIEGGEYVTLAGTILDSHKEPVEGTRFGVDNPRARKSHQTELVVDNPIFT